MMTDTFDPTISPYLKRRCRSIEEARDAQIDNREAPRVIDLQEERQLREYERIMRRDQ